MNPDDKSYKGNAAVKTILSDENPTGTETWMGMVTLTYGALLQERSPMDMFQ